MNDICRMTLKTFFLVSFLSTLLLVVNVFFEQNTSPVSQHEKEDIFTSRIVPQLHATPHSFSLSEEGISLVKTAQASNMYSEARSYIAVDMKNGKILLEKEKDASVPIASLTKIMTAVVALDLASPHAAFEVSEDAANQIPTKIGVVAGQSMTLEELLHALLLTSANDAAEVIREGVNEIYGEEIFIRAMNEKASFLGLSHSSFENPQGFDGIHNFSSASDLATLSHYALIHYPLLADIVRKDYAYLPANASHKQFDLYNWNGLVGVYPHTNGIKIGSTGRAGKTTIVVSEREGEKVVAVLLGAPDILSRDMWAAALLDDAFSEFGITPAGIQETDLIAKYATWEYF